VLFSSYGFIFAYLPIVVAGFYLLPTQRLRLAWVVVASYVFYAWEAWWFPALMVTSTTVSFLAGLAVERAPTARRRLAATAVGVAGALSLLLFFKYANFAAYYGNEFLTTLTGTGLPSLEELTRSIVLPVGISFFTFEAISYVVDVKRGTIAAERNPLRYAFFISFFPHLIAGPIVRYAKLAPQLERRQRFDVDLFRSGLVLFALGLGKKVLIADGIARHIDPALASPESLGALDAWLAMLGYAFQIYFDFSGYTDMALGLARMVGIDLPWNFNRPYRAASPREFWRRWHVTLSTWLRDYLYIPLGGSRKGGARRDANLLATMALGGLWHGASLNFLFWGVFHGGLLAGQHHLERLPLRVPQPVAVVGTFALVTVGWVFFRFDAAGEIRTVLEAMGGMHGLGEPVAGLLPFLAVAAAVHFGLPEEWSWDLGAWGPRRVAVAGAVAGASVAVLNDSVKFLYFQF
jgi:alginate O-acetyltransferase complex protein AlgI